VNINELHTKNRNRKIFILKKHGSKHNTIQYIEKKLTFTPCYRRLPQRCYHRPCGCRGSTPSWKFFDKYCTRTLARWCGRRNGLRGCCGTWTYDHRPHRHGAWRRTCVDGGELAAGQPSGSTVDTPPSAQHKHPALEFSHSNQLDYSLQQYQHRLNRASVVKLLEFTQRTEVSVPRSPTAVIGDVRNGICTGKLKPGSPQCHLPMQLEDVSVSAIPGALSELEALCDYALYKSTFRLHYITSGQHCFHAPDFTRGKVTRQSTTLHKACVGFCLTRFFFLWSPH